MRPITFFVGLLVFLLVGISTQAQVPDDAYSDTLRKISDRIRQGHAEKDRRKSAEAYFDRAMHNFRVHLRDRDVINDLIESGKLFRQLRDDEGFYKARMALANFYIEEDIFLNEAVKLTTEAYQFYKSEELEVDQAKAVTQLGKAYQRKLEYDKAITYVQLGLEYSKKLEDVEMELANRLLITRLLGNVGNVEKLLEQGKYIIEKEKELNLNIVSAETNFLIGSNLMMDDQIRNAIPYLNSSVRLNQASNDLAYQSNTLLAKAYLAVDSLDRAFKHLQKANEITTDLYNKEKYAMANQAAVKFQSDEKDKEIRELEEDNDQYADKLTQRTRFFIVISILLILGALAAYNFYRLQRQRFKMERVLGRQKEEIAQQKINELESSLKIKNLQSMVLGQEAERTRIAEDLHDSLGGMLSSLKLQYDTLQLEHNGLSSDREYQRIMSLIDDACSEVRDIARNLKPIALEKLGLTAALTDLVNRYSIRDIMDISLHTHEVDGVLSDEAKLHVYRIIQELLNNALKHAHATEIDVQVNKMDDRLFIMVEDNGKGFDHINAKQGLGLGNLKSRVNVLRGEMEIDSSKDRGTSITVHIPTHTAQFEISKS